MILLLLEAESVVIKGNYWNKFVIGDPAQPKKVLRDLETELLNKGISEIMLWYLKSDYIGVLLLLEAVSFLIN